MYHVIKKFKNFFNPSTFHQILDDCVCGGRFASNEYCSNFRYEDASTNHSRLTLKRKDNLGRTNLKIYGPDFCLEHIR